MTSSKSPDCGEPRLQKEKQSTSPTPEEGGWRPGWQRADRDLPDLQGQPHRLSHLQLRLWAELRVSPDLPDLSTQTTLTAGTPLSPGPVLASVCPVTLGASWQWAPCPQLPGPRLPWLSTRRDSLPRAASHPPRAAFPGLVFELLSVRVSHWNVSSGGSGRGAVSLG